MAHASLTRQGQRLLAQAIPTAEQVSQELTQAASAGQIDEFAALLGRISGVHSSIG